MDHSSSVKNLTIGVSLGIPFHEQTSNEGILLHLANEITLLNKVFFKAYILKDDSLNAKPSKDLHLEIVDETGRVVIRQLHKIEAGAVDGSVNIPKETLPGKYHLRAYTGRMLQRPYDNFVERTIWLIDHNTKSASDHIDSIQTRIEGGSLIAGKENRLIIYYPLENSRSVSPQGAIFDDKNNRVSKVIMHAGQIGTALLTPDSGRSYFVKFDDYPKIPLPKPVNEGLVLHVNNLDSDNAVARIIRSTNGPKDTIWLSGRIGGKEFFKQPLEWNENTAVFNIDKRLLPSGLLKLRLFDQANRTIAMRPVSIQNPEFELTYRGLNEDEDPNSFRIKTIASDQPTSSRLALSVNKHDWESLITTGIHSTVNPSSIYSNNYQAVNINALRLKNFIQDLYVQIVYGEDRPNNILKKNIVSPVPKIVEGIRFSAYVYDFNNKLLKNSPIQIYVRSDQGVSILEVKSDSQGFIQIENLDFTGTAEFIFRTEGADTKSRLVKAIPIDKEEESIISPGIVYEKDGKTEPAITGARQMLPDTAGLIQLDEATITDNKINKIKGVKSIYGIEIPGKRVTYQDPKRPKTFAQLLVEMPGVFVRNVGGTDDRISIPRVSGQVMWVIDGYMLPQDPGGTILDYPLNSLGPVQDFLNYQDIDRIDLLLGPDAAIFGVRAAAGVISITTRTGADNEFINRKDARLFIKGYEAIVDFESYKQDLSRRQQDRVRLLYWNPNLETNHNGEGVITISNTELDFDQIRIGFSSKNGTF